MSRAFVKEQDDSDAVEDMGERPISEHPNYVTTEGLAQIEAELVRLHAEHAHAQESRDRAKLAHAARDLRYWTARRASAELIEPPQDSDDIRFGSTVTIKRDDGRTQTFRIVGEDEADPAKGTISHASPLAVALFGKGVGEVVKVGGGEAEVVKTASDRLRGVAIAEPKFPLRR